MMCIPWLVAAFLIFVAPGSVDGACSICGDPSATFNEDKLALSGGFGGGSITCKSLNDLAVLIGDLDPTYTAADCEAEYGVYALQCECSNKVDSFVCNICPNGAPLKDPTLELPYPKGTCGGFETTANLLGTTLPERQEQCYNAQRLAPICCDNVEPFCTLCPTGQAITRPDVFIGNFGITCAELDFVTPALRDPDQCLNAKLSGTTRPWAEGCDCAFLEDPFGTATPSSSPTASTGESSSEQPSLMPSISPSVLPSLSPSDQSSSMPSLLSSGVPSLVPSYVPSNSPSEEPSFAPSGGPSFSSAPTGFVVPKRKTRAPALIGTGDRPYGGGGRGGAGGAGRGRNDDFRQLLRGDSATKDNQ